MTHRIKIAASVMATATVTFFAAVKTIHSENTQPEKNQDCPPDKPKLPENFKYDGARRIVR